MDEEQQLTPVNDQGTTEEQLTPVSFGYTPLPPSPKVVDSRSKSFDWAMKDLSPGRDELALSLSQGKENIVRGAFAQQRSTQDYLNNLDQVKKASIFNQGPVTDEEAQQTQLAMTPPVYNPDTVIEEAHSDRLINSLMRLGISDGSSYVTRALAEDVQDQTPNKPPFIPKIDKALRETSRIVTYQQYAKKLKEDIDSEISNSGSVGNIFNMAAMAESGGFASPELSEQLTAESIRAAPLFVDLAKNVTNSFYQWHKLSNILEETSKIRGKDVNGLDYIPLPGQLLSEKVDYLLSSKNMAEYRDRLEPALAKLKADSPYLASTFLAAIAHRTTMDEYLENAQGIADIVGGAQVASKSLSLLLKGGVKYGLNVPANAEQMVAQLGGTVDAATTRVLREAIETNKSIEPGKELDKVIEGLPALYRPKEIVSDMGSQGAEVKSRLENLLTTMSGNFKDVMGRVLIPETMTSEDLLTAANAAHVKLTEQYPKLNDGLHDVQVFTSRDKLTNTYEVEFKIGYTGGDPFPTKASADTTAKFYGFKKGEYEAVDNGASWYISVKKPIEEGMPVAGTKVSLEATTPRPGNFITHLLWKGLNPDNVLSVFNNENRKLATYASSELRKIFKSQAEVIGQLTNRGKDNELEALSNIMKWNNEMDHPTIRGERGYTYKTVAELEQGYLGHQNIQRLPNEREVNAYFAAVQIQEMDLALRNLAITAAKRRQGVESIKLALPGKAKSAPFEGVVRPDFPKSVEDATLLYMDRKNAKSGGQLYNINDLPLDVKKDFYAKMNGGTHRLVQVHSPHTNPLGDAGILDQNHVNFVLTDMAETSPVGYQHLPNKGGWHQEYDYDNFIKQARVVPSNIAGKFSNRYVGDTTLLPARTREEGQDLVKRINGAIDIMRREDEPALKAYVQDNIPGVPYEVFMSWFKETTRDGKKVAAYLNKDQYVHLVGGGQKVKDVDRGLGKGLSGFKDNTSDPYDLSKNTNVGFTGERSDPISEVVNRGTEKNSLFAFESAKTIDPIPMLGRAIGKAVSTRFMEPYQTSSINNWIKEFGHLLEKSPESLANNPAFFFHNPSYLKGADETELKAAQISRYQIRQFLGYKSEARKALDGIHARISKDAYRLFGADYADWYANGAVAKIDNAPDTIRALNFTANMGLFNVPQFMAQAVTATHAVEVTGIRPGFGGLTGAALSAYGKFSPNPKVIAGLDDMAVKASRWLGADYRWKPGEFTEAHNLLFNTGYGNVGGEFAAYDHVTDPKLWRSTGGRILDAGDAFFKGGELTSRMTGLHAAYKEFRAANPGLGLTDKEARQILARADDLNYNMSRASNSALNTGVMSIPFQFQTYAKNAAEQILFSNRLSNVEKARTILVQSALWGVPTGIAGSVGVPWMVPNGYLGMPIYDAIKAQFQDKGINVRDSYLQPLMEGFVNYAVDQTTGYNMDLRQRFGINGLSFLADLMDKDKTWWDLLAGISGSNTGKAILAIKPFWRYATSIFLPNGGDNDVYPMMAKEDAINALRQITSSGNNLARIIQGVRNGQWVNRQDQAVIDGITPNQAVALGIVGTNPIEATDAYIRGKSTKFTAEDWKQTINEIAHELSLGAKAMGQEVPDPEATENHRKRAYYILERSGIPVTMYGAILQRANSITPKADQIAQQWITHGKDDAERKARRDLVTQEQERKKQGTQ